MFVVIAILAVLVVAAALFALSTPSQQEQPTGTTTTMAQGATVNDSEIVSEIQSDWVNESDDVEIGEMV